MSDVLNQAEELRQKMINLLLAERQAIDEKLALVGYENGRPSLRRSKACSTCGSPEHNARTCPRRVSDTQDGGRRSPAGLLESSEVN